MADKTLEQHRDEKRKAIEKRGKKVWSRDPAKHAAKEKAWKAPKGKATKK